MEKYINQLLSDISQATENAKFYFPQSEVNIHEWKSNEEENQTASVRELEEWTRLSQEQLPPAEMLTDEQLVQLLNALKKMLDAYNWSFVLQIETPERIQYNVIRHNFNQQARLKRWHMGFFEVCKENSTLGECALGEYCQCLYFKEMFADFVDEELSQEETRARALEIELNHIRRKYGDEWMKYYPYHLDAAYDDENGNLYNYGLEVEDDEEDEDW